MFFLGCERVSSVFVLGYLLVIFEVCYVFPVCLNKNIILSFEQFIFVVKQVTDLTEIG